MSGATVRGALGVAALAGVVLMAATPAAAQTAPSAVEVAAYRGLHAAAQRGDAAEIARLAAMGVSLDARDPQGRTPLHVAACRPR